MIASYRLIGDTQTVTLIAVCCKLRPRHDAIAGGAVNDGPDDLLLLPKNDHVLPWQTGDCTIPD